MYSVVFYNWSPLLLGVAESEDQFSYAQQERLVSP
jgi:hypothetical protein